MREYETTAEALTVIGIPVRGVVVDLDVESGRVVVETERGTLTATLDIEEGGVDVGDTVYLYRDPIGFCTS